MDKFRRLKRVLDSSSRESREVIEVSRRHGTLRALNMYRIMVVVPGEVPMHKMIPDDLRQGAVTNS